MKRISFFTLATIALFSLTISACQKGGQEKSEVVIGVNQYAQQPILDAVFKGFQDRLAREKNIKITMKNSNADAMTCQQINEQFVQSKAKVIVALGTPAAQSAVKVSRQIPVVFGAITDPVGAKLADSLDKPGGNKTGTTNRWPFEEQVELLTKVLPKAKRVGVVVNPSEANCNAGMQLIRVAAKRAGLQLVEKPFSTSAEVQAAAESLVGNVDVILISPSNTLFSALDSVLIVAKGKTPVFGGDESAVRRGSLATYNFSNTDIGTETAETVLKVLKGDVNPGDIPIARPPKSRLYLNEGAAKEFGITITQDLKAEAQR